MLTESECLLSLMQKCAAMIFLDRREEKQAIAPKVKACIMQYLIDKQRAPSIDDIAPLFFMSSPTFRRHLNAEETSYQAILDELRFELGKELLLKGVFMNDIAATLDFSANSGFSRFFKKVCGIAPQEWAKQHRAAA